MMKHLSSTVVLLGVFCLGHFFTNARAGSGESDGGISDPALSILSKRAESGDERSQFDMAMRYAKGAGVKKDAAKAAELFEKSAEQGNAYAQNFIASAYAKGDGVKRDLKKAARWWMAAADLGYPEAEYNLAVCYASGLGVERNFRKAAELWKKAADAGHILSQINTAALFINGGVFDKDEARGISYLQKAADADNTRALALLAGFYYHGKHVALDNHHPHVQLQLPNGGGRLGDGLAEDGAACRLLVPLGLDGVCRLLHRGLAVCQT